MDGRGLRAGADGATSAAVSGATRARGVFVGLVARYSLLEAVRKFLHEAVRGARASHIHWWSSAYRTSSVWFESPSFCMLLAL